MPEFHLEHLNRREYIASIAAIDDPKSSGFATLALHWWDRHFSWRAHGCIVLADAQGAHLSYIFYKIDRYHEYITIHNLFTPRPGRRNGYAQALLKRIFTIACAEHVRRFRLSSVPQSLDFYLALGFVYWGLSESGDYYCDLPMPADGLDGVNAMVHDRSVRELLGDRRSAIHAKIDGNEARLSCEQEAAHDRDRAKMRTGYLHDALIALQQTDPH